jgi:sugar lactone lactonase YvrE
MAIPYHHPKEVSMRFACSVCLAILVVGCAQPQSEIVDATPPEPILEIFAESDRQWTGVAVSEDGRVFVNFPRWSPEVPVSVAEVMSDGSLRPYPDEAWNGWAPESDPSGSFVCVQSVVADGEGSLWVLDPANAWFQGVVSGGARLIEIDLATDRVERAISFDETVAPAGSYLNDVRIDHNHRAAYITDSGTGSLVVVDLETGASRRVLGDHPSTAAEEVVLTIGGAEWLLPNSAAPQVHADGIAYDRAKDFIYYQALTGRTLYRVAGAALRNTSLDDDALAQLVETVAGSGASDGLLWDGADGIFISAIEDDAVKRWSASAGVETVIQDPRIAWPDSFARGTDGTLYLTTSQIHRGPDPPEPYRILRVDGL